MGGGPISWKKALRNTWMAPYLITCHFEEFCCCWKFGVRRFVPEVIDMDCQCEGWYKRDCLGRKCMSLMEAFTRGSDYKRTQGSSVGLFTKFDPLHFHASSAESPPGAAKWFVNFDLELAAAAPCCLLPCQLFMPRSTSGSSQTWISCRAWSKKTVGEGTRRTD